MMRILSEILVILSASPAISLVAKGTVVVALGLISARFARRSRAAVRHALLASAFGVLLALPIVSVLVPPVPIAVPVATGGSNTWPLFDSISVPSSREPAAERFSVAPAKPGWPLLPLSTMLLYGWCIGAALFMIPILRARLRVRSLRRYGLPWRHGQAVAKGLAPRGRRRLEVLLHESLPGPVTCGVLNPAIFLPADAQSWDQQDLERALVHELEHVRRYDWAIHCLARVACAAYWFHPLVWVAWRRLALEAERSCDDAVLAKSEAIAYADQLVGLARRRRLSAAQKSPALAMANRSDLAARVGALLDNRQARGRAGACLVAIACTVAASMVLTMSPLRMVAQPRAAQAVPHVPGNAAPGSRAVQTAPPTPSGALLSFGTVSIKPVLWSTDRDCSTGIAGSKDPGRFRCPTATLKELLQRAYGVYSFQLDGPGWLDSKPPAFFYVEATMPPDTTKGQLGEMLQTMLAERFKLITHRETRELPIYSLVVGRGGPRMKESVGMEATTDDSSPPQPGPIDSYGMPTFQLDHPAIFTILGPATRLIVKQQTITQFANRLTEPLGRKVIDATGLTAKYDFTLTFANEGSVPQAESGGPPDVRVALREQLGLRLESGSGPVDVIVIDHVDKAPTEN